MINMPRKAALIKGLLTYQGKPCKRNGHTLRYTSTYSCVECLENRYTREGPRKRAVHPGPTYQGKPCKRGHSGRRYSINSSCVECSNASKRENLEYNNAQQRAWRKKKRANDPAWRAQENKRSRDWAYTHQDQASKARTHRRAVNENTIRLLRAEGVLL